ncbi:MAG: hypothetical protein AB7S75_02940 [Desulfococcaceae bacterium]
MSYRTVKIQEADYRYLEQTALLLGTTVQEMLGNLIKKQKIIEMERTEGPKSSESVSDRKSRWAEISARIRKNPPLSGAGDFVRESAKELREDFSFRHDTE